MESSMTVKKAIHYNVIQNILRYYECPDTCKAYCCKNGRVHMLEDEFRFLTEKDQEKAKNIISDSNIPHLYMMNTPCSFLNMIDRCDIYDKRPTVCGLYPFKVNNSGVSLGLQPCPLGFLIIRDFSSWIMDTISRSNIPEDEKAGKIKEWQNNLDSYETELSEFHIKPILKEMQIPFDELDILSMFLFSKNALKNIPLCTPTL
ncbi:YkgJ family cysteine cluster protein [Methanolobus psychrotolerans]|uniref:YkgJ family cysteine cluster protein n=1 Tax=Methanolobus psychrotolerans TaxID=1874706 RepID=UPI000B915AD0|nr:YkgJ family cysteine cluster protein [Methanolobus psychrotolerans]